MTATVAVIGSLNKDIVVAATRTPAAGETVLARGHSEGPGGKGGNQAVAAARLGGAVSMVGRLGDDDAGRQYLELLRREGIDTAHVTVDDDAPTGLAVVVVEDTGDNRILVSAGSNGRLAPQHVADARDRIAAADVALAQLEVPVDAVVEALGACRGTRILNAAPAAPLPAELRAVVDVLIVNESELAVIAGTEAPSGPDDAARMAAEVDLAGTLIVTLGQNGSVVREPAGAWWHEPALDVRAVDTTAAGDAFCGAVAVALADGMDLRSAVRRATAVSAVVVTRPGAIGSLPTAADIDDIDQGDT